MPSQPRFPDPPARGQSRAPAPPPQPPSRPAPASAPANGSPATAPTAAPAAALQKTDERKTMLAMMKRDVVDVVAGRIGQLTQSGELHLPKNYSAENALAAAWLVLQTVEDKDHRPALTVCTPDSIANSLLDMVVQGLSPQKRQCYFIVYGKRLLCMRSYMGTVALLRRIYGQQLEVWPQVVYDGDDFEVQIDRGRKTVLRHVQKLANIANEKIVAAYVIVEPGNNREPHTEVMTIDQIRRAWEQGQTKGGSPAHKGFTDQMALKTVINRAGKLLLNASDDAHLVRAIRRQSVAAAAATVEGEIERLGEPEELEELDLIGEELGDAEAPPFAPAPEEAAPTPPPPPPPAQKRWQPEQAELSDLNEPDGPGLGEPDGPGW